jgi:hypothetical protein
MCQVGPVFKRRKYIIISITRLVTISPLAKIGLLWEVVGVCNLCANE